MVAKGGKRAGAVRWSGFQMSLVTEQFLDAHLFGRVILHDQKALAARLGVLLDLGQCGGNAFGRRRLVDKGERPARQRVLAVFNRG